MAIPKYGVELAAINLLHKHGKVCRPVDKPKYMNAVYHAEYKSAAEMLHDMGYGATESMITSAVAEVYNKHALIFLTKRTVPDEAWQELAKRLDAMKRC